MHRKPIFGLQCMGVSGGFRLDILDEGLGVRSDLPQQIRRVGTCATLPHQIIVQFVYRFQLSVVEVLRKCLISGPKFPFDSLDGISIVSPDGISFISQLSFVLLLLLLLVRADIGINGNVAFARQRADDRRFARIVLTDKRQREWCAVISDLSESTRNLEHTIVEVDAVAR